MKQAISFLPHGRFVVAALGAVLAGLSFVPVPAHSRVWVSFGFPLFPPPPIYYPPPVYYYPPPVFVPPPAYYPSPPVNAAPAPPSGSGQSCYAGAYVCPMDTPVASGAPCYCLGNQDTHVWGHAN